MRRLVRTARRRLRSGERGSAAIEAAVGVPAFLLLIGLVFAGGRVALAGQSVEAAATEAARSASIARTETEARSSAIAAAQRSLDEKGLNCTPGVALDTSDFGNAVGVASSVSATVTCNLGVRDLAVPGLPGTIRISKTMESPIDTYRER
ncbi:TadE/TadG family type IV pilus assembly protein [Isoptericola sp. NPDC019482]|uniref:TadE/TadG family type IV pilus assembly protein n=1 Tax=Isoptericola sp. NPDC019482 TaxID=3154688 RepID=UPI0034931413